MSERVSITEQMPIRGKKSCLSSNKQVIVADQHMVTGANSNEFKNPHTDVRGSVKMMAQQREDNSNAFMQRKRIPSLHTMAVRLAHSRRNADNKGTSNTGARKKARGDKKRNQESGSDREESSVKNKSASASGNLVCESESVGENKRGIEEEINRKKDRDRNKTETNSKERMYQLVPSATGWMDGNAPLPHRNNNTDEVANSRVLAGLLCHDESVCSDCGGKKAKHVSAVGKLANEKKLCTISSALMNNHLEERKLFLVTSLQIVEESVELIQAVPSKIGSAVSGKLKRANRQGLGLNGLHQLLDYVDDVNMPGENPQTIRENTEIFLEATKAIGLEINPEKTKYTITSRDQNIVRNGNIKIGDLSFEELEKSKYLGATIINVNATREEIKRRLNMGNACYYSVEKLLSSSLLSKNLKVRIYKTVILQSVLYGCETWTLTLIEEQRLRVFETKVLRIIFWDKRDEVTGEWRKLHNTELHALYSSPDNIKSRRLRWAGHVARVGESRNAYRVLVGRPEGKRPLGRPRRRWEDNIKTDLRELGYDGRDWVNLPQDRDRWRAYVRMAMNLREMVPVSAEVATDATDWTVYSKTQPRNAKCECLAFDTVGQIAVVTCWVVPFSAALATSGH
ncbi:hypothetical protein ANN_09729 [Periplaneta americana]|uniref:Uncharacterized protein n=1 Tax=Periplaneta americana TaxID=6978 RepID=A0ABQ8TP69_PERAM|nr:hypothetical protein ANN_09729 [Periplaneta americana]